MNRVLIVLPHYLPGYKSGGPQQTVKNICDVFGKRSDIFLVTQNQDFGENVSYDLETNRWLTLYGIHVMYVSPKEYNCKLLWELYNQFDTILACGLFCSSTIQLMGIHRIFHKNRFYVAPMGVFSKNALAIRNRKKKMFLQAFSFIGAFKKIIWSFTSKEERNEAVEAIGKKNIHSYIIAEDLPCSLDFDRIRKNMQDKADPLRIIFLSRIVPKKNLLCALEILNYKFEKNIQFDIYGVIEDPSYWRKCEETIAGLPANISCTYRGSVKPDESLDAFSQHDLFLFPTKGENFGHVIYEALASGCVPIISNTTPWKDFTKMRCGSVIDLEDINGFREAIQKYLKCSEKEFMEYKTHAVDYAEAKYNSSIENSGYKAVFESSQ